MKTPLRTLRAFSCLFVAIAFAVSASAQMLIKNARLSGTTNQVLDSATLTFNSGATFAMASGSTLSLQDLSIALAKLSNSGGAEGDLAYWNGTAWVRIARGTDGQRLVSNATTIAWTTPTDTAPSDATYITQVASSDLSAEQALGALATGILKNTTTTGVLSIAAAATDYVAPGATTTSGLTMATARLLGRDTASTGAIEELTIAEALELIASSTEGDILYRTDTAWSRLARGTDGQVLTATTSTVNWEDATGGSGDVATDTIWDAAGDLVIGTGSDTAARLAIGADTYVLTSNGTTATWAAPTGGSGGGTLTLARWTAADNQPPTANFATLDTRNSILVLDFDASTDESAIFVGIIPEAADFTTGISVRIHWMATSATSGAVIWESSFERSNTDLDADSFATAEFASGTANGTSGIITVTTINHDAGDIDGLAEGELFRLKISRDANGTNGTDDAAGDAELIAVEIRQR
jgi:hypothetical protein